MKKLLFISLLLSSQLLSAQDDRLTFKLKGGIAMPQGTFGESTFSAESEFATNGVVGGIGLGVPLAKNVVLDFDFSRASYKVDEESFFTFFKSILQAEFPGINTQPSISVGSYTNTTAFASLRLMTGSYGTFLYAKPGLGASWHSVPTVISSFTLGGDRYTRTSSFQTSVSLMFNLEAGLLVELNDNISLDLGAQYLFSNFDISASNYDVDNSGNTQPQRTAIETESNFESLNLMVGFLFYINRNE